jgi:RND family efflux transporter MFP subunit
MGRDQAFVVHGSVEKGSTFRKECRMSVRITSFTGKGEPGRRWSRVGLAIMAFLVCAAASVTVGCNKKEQRAQKPQSVNVRVWPAESRSLRPFVESIGTLNPYEQVTVSSELDGILNKIHVDEGAVVTRGQLIAEIKETDYRLAETQAEALLRQSEASLANAQQEYQRKEALYREQLVTKQQFDDISARLALAQADLARVKAGLEMARERLSKTKIFAPMAGAVKEKRVTAGDYIRNGSFIVSIVRTNLLKLSFSVNDNDVGSLRTDQEVVFKVDAFPGREFRGRLKTIYPSLDEKTRSLQVEAVVANTDQSLKPGLFARVTLFTGPSRKTVVAPITALLYDNINVKLFVVDGDKARERSVKLGRKFGEFMEITEGLKEKETVVTVGQNSLMEGVQVNVAR